MDVPSRQLGVYEPWARLVDRIPWPTVSAVLTAAALGASFTVADPIMSCNLAAYVVLLIGVFVSGAYQAPPRALLIGTLVIVGSMWLAVALAENTVATLTAAFWLTLVTPAIAIKRSVLVRGLTYALPIIALHTGFAAAYGVTTTDRVSGIIGNPNPAAALLLLGMLMVFFHKDRTLVWFAPWMLFALAFTGSRWTTVVLALVLAVTFIRNSPVTRKQLVAIVATATVLLLPWYGTLAQHYRVGVSDKPLTETVSDDTAHRLRQPQSIGLLPRGIAHHDGNHNALLRVAHDAGVIAGLSWAFLAFYGLWRGRGVHRWLLGTLVLLGIMDYYAWELGKLSLMWWAVLAVAIRTPKEDSGHA